MLVAVEEMFVSIAGANIRHFFELTRALG